MKKIGLTGGIASGKSTSVKLLINRGFKVIDSDAIVSQILKRDKEVLSYIYKEFGSRFISGDEILRKDFGEYIFKNKDMRNKYEDFVMPKILKAINREFKIHEDRGESLCILDAPILIERNLHLIMDYVVLIWVNKEQQLYRLMKRNGLSKESAISRIESQMDIDVKREFANFIIDNSKDEKFLIEQINSLSVFLNTL